MKKVFVIGDSISIHYGPFLEQYVKGRFGYERKGRLIQGCDINEGGLQNGGDSNLVLEYLTANSQLDYDILLLNCGLHDIRRWDNKEVQVKPDEYEENLIKIISLVRSQGKKVVWITTTPVDDEKHNTLSPTCCRYNRDVIRYNEIAGQVMHQMKVPMIDLYDFTNNLDLPLYEDYVHYTVPVRKLQAAFIAGWISCFE